MAGDTGHPVQFAALRAALVIAFRHDDIAHGVIPGHTAFGPCGVVSGQQLAALTRALQTAQGVDAGIDRLTRSVGAGRDDGAGLLIGGQPHIGLGDGFVAGRTVAGHGRCLHVLGAAIVWRFLDECPCLYLGLDDRLDSGDIGMTARVAHSALQQVCLVNEDGQSAS
ncbi:hypothetical protein [Castellaniella sp.]|uniref:hypothetical protein n=1 Tax=Castellaniella sp. TaxID=1955812 RepID=UPI002AFFA553|nr:hypothetical protein [Castellaniella sp.]